MTIGQRIKRMRIEAGLSQAKLSEKVGVDRSLISQLESDKGTGTSHVAALAYALKVNALWLQTGKGKPDANYTPPIEITKNYGKEVEAIIELLESTDDRGKRKALIAVQDALDAHKAWQASLPLPRAEDHAQDIEGDRSDRMVEAAHRRLGQEFLAKVSENERLPSSDACIGDKPAEDRKGRSH